MNKETTIFIDTQDMEERYGEQLYQEYLEKENKELKSVLNEVIEYILEKCPHSAVFRNERIDKIYEILKKSR